jgi:hypothetical protein
MVGSNDLLDNDLIYVFQLPAKIVNDLSSLLDPGDCWETIGLFFNFKPIIIKFLNFQPF